MGKVEGGVFASIFSGRQIVIRRVELLINSSGKKWIGWVTDEKYIPLRTLESNYRRVF